MIRACSMKSRASCILKFNSKYLDKFKIIYVYNLRSFRTNNKKPWSSKEPNGKNKDINIGECKVKGIFKYWLNNINNYNAKEC
jgi:hypothetical protein